MDRLKDRIAIVTGAAQGIGRGIAEALAREGAVVGLFDISDAVRKTAADIREKGYRAAAFKVDVSNADQVNRAVRQIADEHGKIEILVNNAGMAYFARFVDMSDDMRDKIFNVNFNGMWNCTKATIRFMIKQEYGKIVNVSSVTGPRVATPGLSAYAATKGAISGFARTLALEVAAFGITVNAILPGLIDTPLTQPMAEDFHMDADQFAAWVKTSIPMGRMGTGEDLGDLAVFLASDESKYITGQEIIIDGGNILPEIKAAP